MVQGVSSTKINATAINEDVDRAVFLWETLWKSLPAWPVPRPVCCPCSRPLPSSSSQSLALMSRLSLHLLAWLTSLHHSHKGVGDDTGPGTIQDRLASRFSTLSPLRSLVAVVRFVLPTEVICLQVSEIGMWVSVGGRSLLCLQNSQLKQGRIFTKKVENFQKWSYCLKHYHRAIYQWQLHLTPRSSRAKMACQNCPESGPNDLGTLTGAGISMGFPERRNPEWGHGLWLQQTLRWLRAGDWLDTTRGSFPNGGVWMVYVVVWRNGLIYLNA